MSLLKFLGYGHAEPADAARDTETVHRIITELERLDRDRARYLAAFAYVLARVAHADQEFDGVEIALMTKFVVELGHLSEAQAVLVVQIARSQTELFGGTEDFLVTRQFREMSTEAQRRELLDCVFAVSAADDSISAAEESRIRQIASELGIDHAGYIAARAGYSDKREIIKAFRKSVS
ncbi:MAG: TerB family tellurite resistance protein [Vicinamibacterales bacterium]|jgi:uncharacterized tellurite resistance protein B-like protein|nr:TerB family tellurite resistance protein [Vicinamibacterales bacterium]